jgi:hypothetical protein
MERNLQAEIIELGIDCSICEFADICNDEVKSDCISEASSIKAENQLAVAGYLAILY